MALAGVLRQSTAVDVLIGPFVDATDGATAETGLTITVDVSKNGQALAAKNDATAPTHDAAGTVDGYYNCELDATDTNTVGQLTLACSAAGALPVRLDFQIVEEAVYDILYAASATGAVPVASIASGAITAASIAGDAITAAKIANGAIDAATFAADVDAEILSYIVDDATRIDASALNTASGTTIPAILNDTAEIGAAGAGLTAIPWNANWDAEVQSEVQDAIEANHLDHLLAATYDPASKPGAADALLNELVENDGGVARYTANALEQAPSGGLDAAGVRAAVGLASANLDTQIGTLATAASLSTVDGKIDTVDTVADGIKVKTDSLTFTVAGNVDANIQRVNDVAVAGTGALGDEWIPA